MHRRDLRDVLRAVFKREEAVMLRIAFCWLCLSIGLSLANHVVADDVFEPPVRIAVGRRADRYRR